MANHEEEVECGSRIVIHAGDDRYDILCKKDGGSSDPEPPPSFAPSGPVSAIAIVEPDVDPADVSQMLDELETKASDTGSSREEIPGARLIYFRPE